MRRLRPLILGIQSAEVHFDRRGFRCRSLEAQRRLEQIGEVFLTGYHAALEEGTEPALRSRLEQVELEQRGFAFEGAAMALALQDGLFAGDRLPGFMARDGRRHIFMLHVGAGWAYARLPWMRARIESVIQRFDSMMGLLAVDGYGFHQGYFHGSRYIDRTAIPSHLGIDALSAFDNGLGRALWFYEGADIDAIERAIAGFAMERRADLWAGVGLACAYAGGVSREEIKHLSRVVGHLEAVAQGAAFAAKARQLAGNPAPHTNMACEILCGMSAEDSARCTDLAHQEALAGAVPSYLEWRRNLQRRLARVAQSQE